MSKHGLENVGRQGWADPKMSEGARMERKAFIAYLKREIKLSPSAGLHDALKWVEGRHKRYDAKPGGLGK